MALIPVVVGSIGRYTLDGLANEWDNDPQVRDRLRTLKRLVCRSDSNGIAAVGYVDKSMANAKINSCILCPILRKMHENDLKLPGIDQVQPEVYKVYGYNMVTVTEEVIYQDAWSIRRLLHYVKSILYRPTYPKDSTNIVSQIIVEG